MPAGEVELTAHYASKLRCGGTAEVNGNAVDFCPPGCRRDRDCDRSQRDGYQFDHWVVSGGDIGKTEEELKANPQFTMPMRRSSTAVWRTVPLLRWSTALPKQAPRAEKQSLCLQGEKVTVIGKNRNRMLQSSAVGK